MEQLEQNEDDVRDLSDDDEDQGQHHEEMEEDDDESQNDVEKVSDLDFIAQHAAEPWSFSNDVSKDVITTSVTTTQQHEGNNEEIEMNQSDDESEEEEELESVVKSVSDSSSSSDDESDILEMERKTATKDTYASHKAEAASWLTEEEENMPSGPPRTRNEVDESYDVFDPSELDLNLAGTSSTHESSSSSSFSRMADDNTGHHPSTDKDPTLCKIRSVSLQDLVQIGKVLYRMDNECLVVVEANYTMSPLNEGSVLCAESGVVLGKICEVFGPITNPFYVMRWGNAKTSPPSGASGGRGGNGRNGEKGGKNKRQGKGKGNENQMQLDKDKEEEAKADNEQQSGEKAEEDAKKESKEKLGDSAVEVGVREEEEGVVEMKETKGDGVDDSNEATKTATATATLDTEASLGLTIAVDANTNAITNQSFFTAVIVPSCQPGNVVCSANQHSIVITPVSLTELMRSQGKGTDASNFYDEEVGEEEQEYSDDEMELLARQARNKRDKQQKRGGGAGAGAGGGEGDIHMIPPGDDAVRMGLHYKGSDKGMGKGLDKSKNSASSTQSTSRGGRKSGTGTGEVNRWGHFDPAGGNGNMHAQGPGLGQGLGQGPFMMNTHDSHPYGAPYLDMHPPIHAPSHPNFYPQDGYHHHHHHHQQQQHSLYPDFAHGSQLHDHHNYPQQQYPPYPHAPSQPHYAEQHHHQQHQQNHHQQQPYQQHYQHQHHDPQFSHSYPTGPATMQGLGQGQGLGLGRGSTPGSFKPPLPPTSAPLQFNFPSHIHTTQQQSQSQHSSATATATSTTASASSTTASALPQYVYKPISFHLPQP